MTFYRLAAPAVSIAALFTASTAFAQVTAQQVWDDWKAGLMVYGEGVVTIGSEATVDGVLTVSDLAIDFSQDGTTVTGLLPWVTFTEMGDGTVVVMMAEEYPITISGPSSDGASTTSVSIALRHTELEMTVSGTPEALTYDLAATRYALELDEINDGGTVVDAQGVLALNDLAGTYTVVTGDMRTAEYDVAAGTLDLSIQGSEPETGTIIDFSGRIQDLATRASMIMPLPENTTPETVLADGLAGEGGYTFGASNYKFSVTESGMETTGNIAVAAGSLDFVGSADAVGYTSTASGIAIDVQNPMLPFPVNLSLAEYGLDFLMPLSVTDEPTDFALGVNLTDFAVNEEVWSMIDPGMILPHDPATFIVDLTGTAKLFFDLTDPAQAEAIASAPVPGELHSVNLNDLNIAIAGAQLTGAGGFTFDNTDMTTIPGMPRPEGKLDVQLNGANALIDKLVSMGLLPEEQVMGARMMLGLFAVPVGDDMLTSTIEVNAEGHVMANGQRLQ